MSMKVSRVMTVIQMEKKMIKYRLIPVFIFLGLLVAQSGTYQSIEGNITYLTMDQVYSDVGSLKGAAVGDTMTVFRRNENIGLVVITNVARKSSVSQPLVPISQFQLGDQIRYDKWVPKPEDPPAQQVSQQSDKPSSKSASGKPHWDFKQNATVSLRYSNNKYSEESTHSRGIGTLQYRAGLKSLLHSKVFVYGRSDLADKDLTVYQARIELSNQTRAHTVQIGRVFPSDMSGVGATDGLLFTSKITPVFSAGALAGFQPDYQSQSWNPDVKKIGGFFKSKHRNDNFKLQTLISVVSQQAGNEIDREFSYIKFTGDVKRRLSFSLYQTWDIYRDHTLYNRSALEPTSSQISFRLKPYKLITLNMRYTSRRQVLYNVSGNLLPDSLFVDELRSGWYNSIRFSHDKVGSVVTRFNRRKQSNDSDNASTYIFMNYFSRPIRENLTIQFSANYLKNLLITGFRSRLGVNMATKKFGSFHSEYELYSFGYGRFYDDYLQHSFKAHHTWSLRKSLYGSTSIDYLIDKDYSIFVLYLGLTYKL